MIDERYDRIIGYYGFYHQSQKLCEECGELISAMMKYNIEPYAKQQEHLLEELADVQVVWRQMVAFMGAEKIVEEIMNNKLERQLKRIREEEDEVSSRS